MTFMLIQNTDLLWKCQDVVVEMESEQSEERSLDTVYERILSSSFIMNPIHLCPHPACQKVPNVNGAAPYKIIPFNAHTCGAMTLSNACKVLDEASAML